MAGLYILKLQVCRHLGLFSFWRHENLLAGMNPFLEIVVFF
jgi:hypothetical protein